MNNYEKNLKYRSLHEALTRALNSEFYYEAIFIEYAIIEDRTDSILRHANITIEENSLNNKLKAIKFNRLFKDKYIKNHLTFELIEQVRIWKNKRNNLIHDLINLSYSNEEIKNIALEGKEIVKILSNKSTLVTKYLDKINMVSYSKT